ncbi:MAG: tyrosine-type recombinase/integrase [Lachnospiraceae bacterium]|nr:tyrosine-type recombinase/integrase [Lachnospiraceae bacterium]
MKGNIEDELKELSLENKLDDILKNDFESLYPQYDYDTLIMIGATIDTAIMNLEKKKYVDEKHPYKISVVKKADGLYYRTIYYDNRIKKQKTAKNKLELINWLYDFYHYTTPMTEDMSLRDLYEKWIRERRLDVDYKNISILTYEDDVRAWNKVWSFTELADLPISSIKTGDIMRVAKSITQDGVMTKKAFTRLLSPIKMTFDYAIDYDLINFNPAKNIATSRLRFMREADNSDDVYSRQDRDTLLSYLDDLPDQDVYSLAVQLAACLGKRIGEIRALHWDDYDKENRTLKISRQIARTIGKDGKKTYAEKPLKKNGQAHTIPVVEYAAEVIERLRVINGDKKYILNSAGDLPIETSHFNDHLKIYCEACGIKYRSSHKFRFYGVSEAYSQGIEEAKIVSYANHSSVNMTRHYDRSKKLTLSHDEAEAVFGFTHTAKTG